MFARTLHRRRRKDDDGIFYPFRLCLRDLSFSLSGQDAQPYCFAELFQTLACEPDLAQFLRRKHALAALRTVRERQTLRGIGRNIIALRAPVEKGFERAMAVEL